VQKQISNSLDGFKLHYEEHQHRKLHEKVLLAKHISRQHSNNFVRFALKLLRRKDLRRNMTPDDPNYEIYRDSEADEE